MKNLYERDWAVLPSACDSAGLLGIPDTIALFMDLAAEHAEVLGFDTPRIMKRGLFWVAVRTRAKLYRRPKLAERVRLRTWPEKPGRLRVNRDYLIETPAGEPLVAGKGEWAVVELETGRLCPASAVFSPDMVWREERVWDEPFTHSRDEALDPFGDYVIRSTDIDLGGHMNNAAYLRAMAGAFSCEDWQGMNLRELEISYRVPCYEGERLRFERRREENVIRLRAAKEDGKTAVQLRLVTGTD